jgi:hypothetical protein
MTRLVRENGDSREEVRTPRARETFRGYSASGLELVTLGTIAPKPLPQALRL